LFRLIKKIIIGIFISHLLYLILLKFVDAPITITQLNSIVNGNGFKRTHVNLNEISIHGKLAVIASEDQLFPEHNGFDSLSIKKALAYNKRNPDKVRGASTISQQVAKNVFLWQGRSWIRKGIEVYFTFMIELIWGKKRILEVYLNEAEMGKGIFGIEAASQQYFNHSAKKLTKVEAAKIAASLPNPVNYTVHPTSKYVSKRYPWVLRQMNNLEADPDIQQIINTSR
jgi:monofunctional biosynthetic peptidoglycan transglycosylase